METKIEISYTFAISNGAIASGRLSLSPQETDKWLERMKGVLGSLAEIPAPPLTPE